MSDSKQCKFCNQGYFDCGGPYYFGQDVECVNGVLIDIDEAHEGWQPDVCYPLAPCHPNYETREPNDSDERLAAWASLGEAAMTHDNVTDIEKRLRNFALNTLALIPDKLQQYPKTEPDLIIKGFSHQCDLLTEAADTIATLRKQLENAREALQFYANYLSFPLNAWVQPTKVDYSMAGDGHWPDGPPIPSSELLADQGKIARKALSAIKGDKP